YHVAVFAEYEDELLCWLRPGLLLAAPNPRAHNTYTLLSVTAFRPGHFGIEGLGRETYPPFRASVLHEAHEEWRQRSEVLAASYYIEIQAVPVGWELTKRGEEYVPQPGHTHPIIGGRVYVLSHEAINQLYNQKLLQTLSEEVCRTWSVGELKIFEQPPSQWQPVSLLLDFTKMCRYHFGVFGYTGCGKSNFVSLLIRKFLQGDRSAKVIVFDISSEYPALLLDCLHDYESLIATDETYPTPDNFVRSVVKPDSLVERTDRENLPLHDKLLELFNKIEPIARDSYRTTLGEFLSELRSGESDRWLSPLERELLRDLRAYVEGRMRERGLTSNQPLDAELAHEILERFNSLLIQRGLTRIKPDSRFGKICGYLKTVCDKAQQPSEEPSGLSISDITRALNSSEGPRLIEVFVAEPSVMLELVTSLSEAVLQSRKREARVEPRVLFIFDEAQEYIPRPSERGVEKEAAECSRAVERLARQGRKYGLGVCIASQRVAHLNASVLAQLHTFFVGPLPRTYDRTVVSEAFSIDKSIIDACVNLQIGEWLVSSHVATGLRNTPIIFKAENSEDYVVNFLRDQAR
ncbi:ATP-binding protein, partial [archaeon]|nr:ATP-binding protein [archaeon]